MAVLLTRSSWSTSHPRICVVDSLLLKVAVGSLERLRCLGMLTSRFNPTKSTALAQSRDLLFGVHLLLWSSWLAFAKSSHHSRLCPPSATLQSVSLGTRCPLDVFTTCLETQCLSNSRRVSLQRARFCTSCTNAAEPGGNTPPPASSPASSVKAGAGDAQQHSGIRCSTTVSRAKRRVLGFLGTSCPLIKCGSHILQ